MTTTWTGNARALPTLATYDLQDELVVTHRLMVSLNMTSICSGLQDSSIYGFAIQQPSTASTTLCKVTCLVASSYFEVVLEIEGGFSCSDPMCDTCNADEWCKVCTTPGWMPIDGVCKTESCAAFGDACKQCTQSECLSCLNSYILYEDGLGVGCTT